LVSSTNFGLALSIAPDTTSEMITWADADPLAAVNTAAITPHAFTQAFIRESP
jgi:hypothetical protein